MTSKRFVVILELDIAASKDCDSEEVALYISGVLNHLQPEDRVIDVTAQEVTAMTYRPARFPAAVSS